MRIVLSLFPLVLNLACSETQPTTAAPQGPAVKVEKVVAPAKPAEADPVKAEAAIGEPGVFFENLRDGATIFNGFELAFGLRGKTVSPAGLGVDDSNLGHHHLIIDGAGIDEKTPVPADATHIHFGKGQLNHILNLAPGQHTLTLQFADGAHRSYGPAWSTSVTVTVEAAK
ncbi:MAG: DUF4399 domain-containing protein [Myxococcota bacterium]|jgi:hypothetical protein|nr:DUF4399 domain-containing protein [Myxococcota bacterium]